MKVPNIQSAGCPCGWRKQTVKHVLLFCPRLAKERGELIQQAGTSDYKQLLTQKQGIRTAARWMIRVGCLDQFSLAREQLAQSKLPLKLDEKVKPKKRRRKGNEEESAE